MGVGVHSPPQIEHPVAVTMHPTVFNHAATLEKMTQIMFETFNTPALVIVPSDVAALYVVPLVYVRVCMCVCACVRVYVCVCVFVSESWMRLFIGGL
jgi:hypothetical protein